jgi:cell division protein FtsB
MFCKKFVTNYHSQESEISKLTEQLKQLQQENQNLERAMDNFQEDKIRFMTELDTTKDQLARSEHERTEIRNVYVSLSQKVESLIQHDSDKISVDEMNGGITVLKHRMKDIKQKLGDEMKQHRTLQKSQKKRVKEVEQQLEEKNLQLNDANVIIMKCQAKIEKYKERLDEEQRNKHKTEKDAKRAILELEESYEREKRSLTELQREFSKKIGEKQDEMERKIRDQYENRLLELQRQVYDKEQQLTKSNFEQMVQQQLQSVRKSMQPEPVERMLEVYEAKIKAYQKDYISRSEHEQYLREIDQRFKLERQTLKNKYDAEGQLKLRELEDRKTKEFNSTLANIKEGVRTLEQELDKEKSNGRKLLEKVEREHKSGHTLQLSLEEQDQKKKMMAKSLEEATDNVSRLKEMLQNENQKRLSVQKLYDDMLEEGQQLRAQIEELKSHSDMLDRVITNHKGDMSKLRHNGDEDSQKIEILIQEKRAMREMLNRSEGDRKRMVDVMRTTLHYLKQPVHLEVADVDGLCRQLSAVVIDCIESNQRVIEQQAAKLAKSKQYNEWLHFDSKQRIGRLELAFREKIALLKREMNGMRAEADRDVANIQQFFQQQMDVLVRKSSQLGISTNQSMFKAQKQFDAEKEALRMEYQERVHDANDKAKAAIFEAQQRIQASEDHVRDVAAEKAHIEQDLKIFLKKFEDLKRFISVINSVISLPADVQNGILSTQKLNVEKSLQNLKEVLERYEGEKQKGELILIECKKHALAYEEELKASRSVCDKLERERDELFNAVNTLKDSNRTATEMFDAELKVLNSKLITLEQQYQLDIKENVSSSNRLLRSSYEKKMSELKNKMSDENARVASLNQDRLKLSQDLRDARKDLSRATSEIEEKKSSIVERDREEKRKISDIQRQVQEKDRILQAEERQKQMLVEKMNKKDEQIRTLHNLLEKNMRSLNRSLDEGHQNASRIEQQHLQLSHTLSNSGTTL